MGKKDLLVGSVCEYDNGQARIEFIWRGLGDGFAWSVSRQVRLAEYRTLRELRAAYEASDNCDGAYGCALLRL